MVQPIQRDPILLARPSAPATAEDAAVVPAYHMNKRHWISVILDGTMEDEEILRLMADSFALTAKGKRGKRAT